MELPILALFYHILLLLFAASPTSAAAKPRNAILLSEVQSLTLRADKQTTHRRVPALPQLKCISKPAICAKHTIDTMRCVNSGHGYDDQDVQWSCTASLPPELKLGSTDVICEGYAGPDDQYVLKGSCGVEYRLVLTDKGEERWPDLGKGKGGWGGGGGGRGGGGGGDTDWSAWIFLVIFLAVLVWIIWSALTQVWDNNGQPRPRPPRAVNFWGGGGGGGPGGWGPGGGGGGGGRFDDPPPPYPGSKPSKPSGSQGGWQPGFWSGLAGGAAAGYFAGNRNTDRRQQDYNRGGYGSTWGSNNFAGPSRSGSGSSSGSSSTARYESTGFGSTSRR